MLTPDQQDENMDRVLVGAAWLDEVDPDWYTRVDTEILDLESLCGCVLGQIVSDFTYGDFNTVVGRVPSMPELKRYYMTMEEAILRGFQVGGNMIHDADEIFHRNPELIRWHNFNGGRYGYHEGTSEDFKSLTALWKRQINQRLNHAD